jgi:hypothetical protein
MLWEFQRWVGAALPFLEKREPLPAEHADRVALARSGWFRDMADLATVIRFASIGSELPMTSRSALYMAIERIRRQKLPSPVAFPELLQRMSSLTESTLRVHNAARAAASPVNPILDAEFRLFADVITEDAGHRGLEAYRKVAGAVASLEASAPGRHGDETDRTGWRRNAKEAVAVLAMHVRRESTPPAFCEQVMREATTRSQLRMLAAPIRDAARYVMEMDEPVRSDGFRQRPSTHSLAQADSLRAE